MNIMEAVESPRGHTVAEGACERQRRQSRRGEGPGRRCRGISRHCSALAAAAGQYGLSLLPGPWTSGGDGAGGFPARIPQAEPLAERCRFLKLAIRAGCKPLSFTVTADSDEDGAAERDSGT